MDNPSFPLITPGIRGDASAHVIGVTEAKKLFGERIFAFLKIRNVNKSFLNGFIRWNVKLLTSQSRIQGYSSLFPRISCLVVAFPSACKLQVCSIFFLFLGNATVKTSGYSFLPIPSDVSSTVPWCFLKRCNFCVSRMLKDLLPQCCIVDVMLHLLRSTLRPQTYWFFYGRHISVSVCYKSYLDVASCR